MEIQDICKAIAEIKDEGELSKLNSFVIATIKNNNRKKGLLIKNELSVGTPVIIVGINSKLSESEGTIVRVKNTKAVVNIDNTRWNVPLSMIKIKS